MKEIKAKFLQRIKRTPTVESFRFKLAEKIDFFPGQFLQVVFDEASRSNKELNKYLSFSSSPTKDYVEITKRISESLFSKRLLALKEGEDVLFKAPMGECVFRKEYQNIIFLIGGIGITPVISILEYIQETKSDVKVSLFYSNRTEDDIAFKKELDLWQSENKNLQVFYTVTECQPKDNTCFFGYINRDLIRQKACDIESRIIYIFGPPKMVDAMQKLALEELACKKENIKTERFMGY